MQFYLNGYKPGDPDILDAAPGAETRPAGLPDTVDVLIVGTGPAGMVLAAQLSTFPGITTRIVDRREGPLQVGQADGVACRTVEMFDAFGLSGKLVREGYWVNETVFWRPSPDDRSKIVRTGRVQDTEDGLSEFPHLIVNQARLLSYLQDYMQKSPTRLVPDFGMDFMTLTVEP
ncbi:MAG: FAD-dependent monooxygenase, partial [Microvirga sp.]